ncbi:MAG TPA: phosphatidylglycerophosphate synthase, partial [Arenibacter sp.]|nr:phosphatidylglycerophosphate synthase [Arenibacter sp.]
MYNLKNFNIADWFSFYRIMAVPLLLALIWYGER